MPSAGVSRSNETEAASAIAPNAQNSSAPLSHRSGRLPTPSSASAPVIADPTSAPSDQRGDRDADEHGARDQPA